VGAVVGAEEDNIQQVKMQLGLYHLGILLVWEEQTILEVMAQMLLEMVVVAVVVADLLGREVSVAEMVILGEKLEQMDICGRDQ
jgi:hypothetical protein